MPKNSLNVSLKGADDIFSTEESRQEQQREQVQQIPIGELFPFKNHPFKVLDDESMQRTVESVEQYGVLSPLIARPRPEGGYEIISGHRRQHAAQLAGLDALPVIVRQMDDDAAVLLMVDSNLQRENILPSERAFAYKMKLEALKNQGARSDLTCGQFGHKLIGAKARDIVADESGDNARNLGECVLVKQDIDPAHFLLIVIIAKGRILPKKLGQIQYPFPQLREYRRSLLIAALYHHREQEGRCAAGLYQLRQFFFGNVQNGHRHESRRELLLLIKDLVIPDIHCKLREIVVLLYSQRHSIALLSHICFASVPRYSHSIKKYRIIK